ncbi:MAG TPA: YqgE/AlgH family protein [Chromatiales bacterium]|nr:YqgE/AlgH family protein [Chromatiales bacterium]
MDEQADLTNHFLIAMPGLKDSNFSRTVTYICEHNEHGAMGIVINRPMELHLEDILTQLDIQTESEAVAGQTVYAGGPVQTDRGFVIHTGAQEWDSTLKVTEDIEVTTSRDVLAAIARGEGPEEYLVALGYAGWGSGQLEDEMSANAWLSGPASKEIIFRLPPEQRWQAAASLLGVDLNLLSGDAGHA